MNTATLILLMVIGQSDGSPLAKTDTFSADLQWKAIEASPRIHVRGGLRGSGSSVIVAVKPDAAYAITAAHVVSEGTRIEADLFARASYPASDYTITDVSVIAKSKTADLALLRIPLEPEDDDPPALKLIAPGKRPKSFSFPVLTVGSDDGYSARCLENQVIGKRLVQRTDSKVAFFWETQQTSQFGRSGGPLIDKDGRVIGICAANESGAGYFVHTDEIHAWLKQLGYEWLWKEPNAK